MFFVSLLGFGRTRAPSPQALGPALPPGVLAGMIFAFQHMTDAGFSPVSVSFISKTRGLKLYFCTDLSSDVPLLAPNMYVIFISIL